jgi:hypothetical protein
MASKLKKKKNKHWIIYYNKLVDDIGLVWYLADGTSLHDYRCSVTGEPVFFHMDEMSTLISKGLYGVVFEEIGEL